MKILSFAFIMERKIISIAQDWLNFPRSVYSSLCACVCVIFYILYTLCMYISAKAGNYSCCLPITVADEESSVTTLQAYQQVQVQAEVVGPQVVFSCDRVHLTPVPLDTHSSAVVGVEISGFAK